METPYRVPRGHVTTATCPFRTRYRFPVPFPGTVSGTVSTQLALVGMFVGLKAANQHSETLAIVRYGLFDIA